MCIWVEKRRGGNDGRKISRKLKGKVLDSCVVPASTYGLETLALSELHQHKLQVCENNWIRRIVGVRRVERWRMKDLREEVGTKACRVGKIVKSRMKWAGHMVRIRDKEARRFQKTRKTTTNMGRLCEERSEKGRGGRKVERKGQQQGPMETNYKCSRTSG